MTLTPQQRQLIVLGYVQGYLRQHDGVAPSVREIAFALGYRSASSVQSALRAMRRSGAIKRPLRLGRAIEVLIDVPVPTAPDGAPLYFVPLDALPAVHGVDNA